MKSVSTAITITEEPTIQKVVPQQLVSPIVKFKDAIAYLQTSERSLHRIKEKIGFVKIGGKIYFKKTALDRYIDHCSIEPVGGFKNKS